jgi:hypothetical protein
MSLYEHGQFKSEGGDKRRRRGGQSTRGGVRKDHPPPEDVRAGRNLYFY